MSVKQEQYTTEWEFVNRIVKTHIQFSYWGHRHF